MATLDAIRDQLVSDIETTFRDVQLGNGMTLFEADLEGTGSEADRRCARSRDWYPCWMDIPDYIIDRHFAALSFLDPEGFHYYIPAFMRFALRRYRESNSPSIDYAIYAFAGFDDFREYCEPRFLIFSEEQAKVICRFLRFMAEHTEEYADDNAAGEALRTYWGKFCDAADC